jgi:hypothetical protein
VSIWRILPRPVLPMIPSAADASAIRSASTLIFQSHRIDAMPNVSLAVLRVPYNSASADDKAIVDWFLDHDFIKCDHAWITPPEVDVRVFLSPAESLSLNAVRRATGFCHSYFMTGPGFPFKYLPSLFSSYQFVFVGAAMLGASCLTANW